VPWEECNEMDERLKFIARLLDGERMAVLCRLFGIPRKTSYKILTRDNDGGLEGLTDRSRPPLMDMCLAPLRSDACRAPPL
jgi:putative transposase